MKAFIIEDEPIARDSLVRLIKKYFDDVEIAGTAGSVKEAVAWLGAPEHRPDIIFMDVELSDGSSFEIFRHAKIDACVIMTTAYDSYALKAFEVNSVDYLLKPIEPDALKRAVGRCRTLSPKTIDVASLLSAFRSPSSDGRKRFIVRFNDNIIPVPSADVAYFYSEDKCTWLVTKEDARYILDQSLDIISEELDHKKFFRISRSCIVSMDAIESITKQFGGRLLISARPRPSFEMTVSRSRVDDFLRWLED